MKLQQLLISLLRVALAECLQDVYGYLGDTITLPSGADPSWNLSKIEWSVFPNNTWIATYRNGKKNIERISQYKGRLSLNISSGNLMIHNLTKDDEREYTVDLINTVKMGTVNKIKLTVRKHLEKPTIKMLFNSPEKGGCWMGVHCFSEDKDVDISWQVEPLDVTAINMSNPGGNPGDLVALLKTTQKLVKITCTSSRTTEKVSSAVTFKCEEHEPQPESHTCSNKCGVCFIFGIFTAVVITMILYIFREKIKAAWKYLKGKLYPS